MRLFVALLVAAAAIYQGATVAAAGPARIALKQIESGKRVFIEADSGREV
jgi:hypothetical protein